MSHMTIRAKRLSNAVIRETITPDQFAALVDEGRSEEFLQLLQLPGQNALLQGSLNAVRGFARSASLQIFIGSSGFWYEQALLDGAAVTGLILRRMGLDPADYAGLDDVLSAPVLAASILNSADLRAIIVGSDIASVAVCNSAAAMGVVLGSSTLRAWMLGNPRTLTAMTSSPAAMALVAEHDSMMTAIIGSVPAKLSCYESDVALSAFLASSFAMSKLRAAATLISKEPSATSNTNVSLTTGVTGGSLNNSYKYICLGASRSWAFGDVLLTVDTKRAATSMANAVNSTGSDMTASSLMCAPITGTLRFKTNVNTTTGTGLLVYLSVLRCDA